MLNESRKQWLSYLATADEDYLILLWVNLNMKIKYNWLREPEIGSVMVQGKAGATGDNFNVGEVTITRCSVNLDKKIQGHGYVQGRNKYKSKIAALCDALMQTEKKEIIKKNILDKLVKYKNNKRNEILSKTEATKVDFFTLVRGEDK